MTRFELYSKNDAPEGSRHILQQAEERFGFVPNVLAQMAESPATLASTLHLMTQLEGSSLTPAEQWITLLVVASQNDSNYCVAANSTVASMMGVPAEVVDGIRRGEPLADSRLEVLRRFTAAMVAERGRVPATMLEEFLAAGFTRAQIFEVVLAVSLETMASYTDLALGTPLDPQYATFAWSGASTATVS